MVRTSVSSIESTLNTEAARTVATQADLQALLCEKAFDLTSTDRAGSDVAIQAMKLLAKAQPKRRAEAMARTLPIHQKRYTLARGDQRSVF